jgi:hypothetical protein
MGNEPPPVMGKTIDVLHELKNVGMDAFKGLAQGFSSMIQAWVQGGDLGPHALRKMTAAVLAAASAQAIVEAIMETARGFAALARYDPISATNHFTAAAIFGGVGVAAAVAGKLIAPKNESVAGNAFASDSSAGATGSGSRTFNYGGNGNFSASQANASGSRTDGIFSQLLAEQRETNAHLRNMQTVSMDHVVAVGAPNNQTVLATALQGAIQSSHPIARDITSLGSTGRA